MRFSPNGTGPACCCGGQLEDDDWIVPSGPCDNPYGPCGLIPRCWTLALPDLTGHARCECWPSSVALAWTENAGASSLKDGCHWEVASDTLCDNTFYVAELWYAFGVDTDFTLQLYNRVFFLPTATYRLAGSSWNCTGPNTLSLVSHDGECDEWPETLTVVPGC